MKCYKWKNGILKVELEVTGGCYGHEDEYCYCNSQDIDGSIYCDHCTFRVKPHTLSDRDSINRILAEHISEDWIKKSSKI